MIISLCGTHGTGKTTILNKMRHNGQVCVEEPTRILMPMLGWNNPYDFIKKYGIAFYESIIMNQWVFLLQTSYRNFEKNIYVDTSPIDNLAYYFLYRTEEEKQYEEIFCKMCKLYCSYIDKYILFKCGMFEFVADSMRSVNKQAEHEKIIVNLMDKFELNYYVIKQKEVLSREKEIYLYLEEVRDEKF